MSYKVQHNPSAARTEANGLIAEAWLWLVDNCHVPSGLGVMPVDEDCEVFWVASEDGDPVGVLVFRRERATCTIQVPLLYTEPSMRRRGVMKAIVTELYARARNAGFDRVHVVGPMGDVILPHLFREPVEAGYEVLLGG